MRDSRAERDEQFDAFVSGSSRRLLHIAYLVCGDAHRAEDLVQAALVQAYPRWDRITTDPFDYVRRAVINGNVSRWRKLGRESPHADVPDGPARDELAAADDRDALRQAMRVLTRRERAVVVLRYIEDLSEQQTAAELDMAVGTVKSTASRAMAKMRAAARIPTSEGNHR